MEIRNFQCYYIIVQNKMSISCAEDNQMNLVIIGLRRHGQLPCRMPAKILRKKRRSIPITRCGRSTTSIPRASEFARQKRLYARISARPKRSGRIRAVGAVLIATPNDTARPVCGGGSGGGQKYHLRKADRPIERRRSGRNVRRRGKSGRALRSASKPPLGRRLSHRAATSSTHGDRRATCI